MSETGIDKPRPVSAPDRAGVPVSDDDTDKLLRDLLLDVQAELRQFRQRRSPVVPLWFAAVGVWLLLLIQMLVPVVFVLAD